MRSPRAVVVALALQIIVLPTVAFGPVQAFQVDPPIAVGVMLLAASPGGTTAKPVAIVLVPVGIGMVVRQRSEAFAARADRPVWVFSIVVLVAVSLGAILGERENLGGYLREVGAVAATFGLASLALGYTGAPLLRLGREQAVASAILIPG